MIFLFERQFITFKEEHAPTNKNKWEKKIKEEHVVLTFVSSLHALPVSYLSPKLFFRCPKAVLCGCPPSSWLVPSWTHLCSLSPLKTDLLSSFPILPVTPVFFQSPGWWVTLDALLPSCCLQVILVIYIFFFFFNYFTVPCLPCSMQNLQFGLWNLVPWLWMESGPPALGAQSLSHWTTREFPIHLF